MHSVLLAVAVVHLATCLGVALYHRWGMRRIDSLDEEPPAEPPLPSLSLVVAARNEQEHLGQAVRSLLEQDYPDFELVVVDDRSTDRTPEILAALAASSPRLKILRIDSLPPGWLGKNHALHRGIQATQGELVLLTDADVSFQPSALRRAVGYLERRGLDHLALFPRFQMPSRLLESFVTVFALYFTLYMRPWLARDPRHKAYIGVGAFNLFRRRVYQAVGGHEPIRMRPDDDVILGKRIKQAGFRQDVVEGIELAQVPWYASVRQAIAGLEKNTFAGMDYRVGATVAASLAALLLHLAPFIGVLLPLGPARWVYLAVAVGLVADAARVAAHQRLRPSSALFFPAAVLLMNFIVWRTMVLTLWQRGMWWRGTFYPLEELRANQV